MPGHTTPTTEEDFLEVDQEIPGQKFVCLSFLSPENVLPLKEHFMAQNFLADFEIDFKIKLMKDFVHKLVTQQQQLHDRMVNEFRALCPEETHERVDMISRTLRPLIDPAFSMLDAEITKKREELASGDVRTAWDDYMYANKKRLEEEFFAKQDFHTTVRGVKVRGVYDSRGEADARAKALRRRDKNFHVFVGNVGYWLPWDPAANEIQNQEYMESELNTLAQKYKENEEKRTELYELEKQEKIKAAREEAARARAAAGMTATVAPRPELAGVAPASAGPQPGEQTGMSEDELMAMFAQRDAPDLAIARHMQPDAHIV